MNFAFSDEQEMLRLSTREFLAARYPPERVASLADGEGPSREDWLEVVGLGWTTISAPESEGGAGLGFVEEIIVAEEAGRAVLPGPFLSCVVMALTALRGAGATDLARAVASGQRIATVAWAGPDGTFDLEPPPAVDWDPAGERLSAVRLLVPDLSLADLVVVVGGAADQPGLWAVDRDGPGVRWRELPTVDGTRRVAEIALDRAPVSALPATAELLHSIRARALAALAAEAVGVASAALDLGLGHARSRQQFGRPIGAFQAVGHQLVDAFVQVETARSLSYWAGWAVADGAEDAEVAAAGAKARAAASAVEACERAIQVHGGTGFTWEHALHRLYRRALGISQTFATGPELRRIVASYLLDAP